MRLALGGQSGAQEGPGQALTSTAGSCHGPANKTVVMAKVKLGERVSVNCEINLVVCYCFGKAQYS